jgi:sulfopyruvate decarboxylase alpha subunit
MAAEKLSAPLELLKVLKGEGIAFYASFPDRWLASLLVELDGDPGIIHVPTTIEREAMGIAVGAQLAGMRSALVMQNSGIGNLLNDWASLALNYGVPVPWIVSQRGSEGEQIETQKVWNGVLTDILSAARIPSEVCSSPAELARLVPVIRRGYETRQSVALLFPYVFWKDGLTVPRSDTPGEGSGSAMSVQPRSPLLVSETEMALDDWRRYEALELIMRRLTDQFAFVNIGDPCKEVFAIRDRPGNFYMLGSLGMVTPLGVGFALAYAARGGRRKSVVLDGDGSQLMNLGALGTFAHERPDMTLIILDNGVHGSTGNQPSLTRGSADLEAVARALGVERAVTVWNRRDLERHLGTVLNEPGPNLTVVKVRPGAPATSLVNLTPLQIRNRFTAAVAASYPTSEAVRA